MTTTFTDRQIGQYFQRIGCTGSGRADLAALEELQLCHLLHIPYENLDLLNGVPLSLAAEALFRKIVLEGRGGYCFELQGLFYALLRSLGFAVTQYAGRFIDGTGVTQMRRHRVLVVALAGERYVCDVGVRNESPRRPLRLRADLVQTDGVSDYVYRRDPFYGWVLFQREQAKDWQPMLGFTEEVQIDADYVMPSFFCERHPDSTFNKFMKISLFTPDSDLTLVENTFKIYRGGRVTERRELHTEAEARTLLTETFGIAVPASFHRFLYRP